MVAPTGVNEGLPQEPAKAGQAGAELAEPAAAEANPGETAPAGAGEKAGPTGVVPAGVVPAQAGPATGERTAAGSAEARSPEAEPEVSSLAEAETEPAGAEPAGAEPAGAEPAGAEPAGAEPAGPGESTEADWDAEESRRDVSPLAVAGIILGVIALVGVAVGVLAVLTHGFRPKTVVTYRPAAVFGLRPGQCVDSGSDALKFTVLSCAHPHDAEVFAAFSLPAAAWPGASAVQADAGDGCASRLDSYIDPQLAAAGLTQDYVYPNQAAWQAGERTVVCEVRAESGQLTGSVRATG
jgi:Septum formation